MYTLTKDSECLLYSDDLETMKTLIEEEIEERDSANMLAEDIVSDIYNLFTEKKLNDTQTSRVIIALIRMLKDDQ